MIERKRNVTRGSGLLEGFLSRQRDRRADSLIPEVLRQGRILDIGCGSHPAFLSGTRFRERYGIDRVPLDDAGNSSLKLIEHDIGNGSALPFEDAFFDVVTMLAVFEHIEADLLCKLLLEIRRVLRPGAIYVMTTPISWTAGILKAMSHLKLVSHEEIGEHKAQYTRAGIVSHLVDAGFERSNISHGTFELGMNVWAVARKA